MKKLMLLFCTILCYSVVNAQEIKTTADEDYEGYLKDSLELYEARIPYIEKDCGQLPKLLVNATVRYTDHAETYLEFESEISREQVLFVEGEGIERMQLNLDGNRLNIEKLPLDKTLKLVAINGCDQEIGISMIETNPNTDKYVSVSSENIFNLATEWAGQEKKESSLHSYILSLKGVSRYEKLSFIQNYYMMDNTLETPEISDDILISILNRTGTEDGEGDDCKCRIMELRSSSLVLPGEANFPNGPATVGGVKTSTGNFGNNRSEWDYNASYIGAAKKISFTGAQRGMKGNSSEDFGTQGATNPAGGNLGSGLFATIKYSLVCANGQQNPGNCDCDRKIDVGYFYNTRLKAHAEKGQCALCTNRSAFAKVEDWAGIIINDANGISVPHINGAMLAAECEVKVNKDFILAVSAIAASIAVQIALPGSTAAFIGILAPQIDKVIATNIFDINTCKGSEERDAKLLDGQSTMVLKPGKTATATLFSYEALKIGGNNGFKVKSSINSNFYLATVFQSGTVGKDRECCMPAKADWLSATLDGPNTNGELKNLINHFTIGQGLNANSNIGTTVGDVGKVCGSVKGIIIKP